MKVICAWCGKVLRSRWPYDSDKISHGICGGCAGELKRADEDVSKVRREESWTANNGLKKDARA